MVRVVAMTAALAWASGGALGQEAQPRIRALILTGENNHNWRYTSRVHEETLESSGRFDVDVADDPTAALSDTGKLSGYQLLVLDYNGKAWGDAAQRNFVKAVEGGTGLVVIHAANNAFTGWEPYEQMVGLLWREGTGHGSFHEFEVEYVNKGHPVTRGLTGMKAHPDELYHDMKNPTNARYEVLARAFSDTKEGGNGKVEPMAIVLTHRQGRVFHTTLGHVWEGQENTKRSISDPQFKLLLCRGAEWAATGNVTLGQEIADKREHNVLSEAEKKDGWVLLFDGKDTANFRGFKKDGFPEEGWSVEDGTIRHVAGKGGGDIMTREQYANYEFACEWKVAPKGNSGIIYRCTEDGGATYVTGPEMQVLDNAGHADGHNSKTSAGSLYAMIESAHDVFRPAGEWNSVRIVVNGDHVEHWANGWKIVEYELNSPQWDTMVNASKFKDWKEFGRKSKGHIALQDHGDDVWYRNIKIKPLP